MSETPEVTLRERTASGGTRIARDGNAEDGVQHVGPRRSEIEGSGDIARDAEHGVEGPLEGEEVVVHATG